MKILEKLFSGRWVMTVSFTITYCVVILLCTYAMLKKILAVETAVALIAGFALIVREIAIDYFNRDDRTKEAQK